MNHDGLENQTQTTSSARPLSENIPSAKAGYVAWIVLIGAVATFGVGLYFMAWEMVLWAFPMFGFAIVLGLIIFFVSKRRDKSSLWAALTSLVLGASFLGGFLWLLNEALSKS